MQAYILIQTGVGRLADLVRDISRVRGVRSAHGVTGAYDVIALANTALLVVPIQFRETRARG